MKHNSTSEKSTVNKYSRQVELLNDIQSARLIGSWEWEPETDYYFWTDSMFFLHGLTPSSDNLISIEAAHQMIYPDDFVLMNNYWEELHKTGDCRQPAFGSLPPDGKIKPIHAQGKAILAPEGQHFFRGSFQEEKRELQQYLS